MKEGTKARSGNARKKPSTDALKFHSPDGKPEVSISAKFSRNRQSGMGEYTISVQDNGTGFDQEYRDRIFLPFERSVTPWAVPGVGMGLAICRKIVERHRKPSAPGALLDRIPALS